MQIKKNNYVSEQIWLNVHILIPGLGIIKMAAGDTPTELDAVILIIAFSPFRANLCSLEVITRLSECPVTLIVTLYTSILPLDFSGSWDRKWACMKHSHYCSSTIIRCSASYTLMVINISYTREKHQFKHFTFQISLTVLSESSSYTLQTSGLLSGAKQTGTY